MTHPIMKRDIVKGYKAQNVSKQVYVFSDTLTQD